MPDLTTEQINELFQDLLKLRDELQRLMDDSAEGARPVSLETPIGRLSRMDALQQQSMTRANRQTTRNRLDRVELALRRHSDGEYGICRECEESIGFARLKAHPEALFCVECQTQKEAGGG